jgi:UPF0271 protein
MTLRVDLNCDLGEGCGNDAELMKYISSANIACGGHAGDIYTMRRTVELALKNDVAIGAHPGYKDRENFGRLSQELGRDGIIDLIKEQIAALQIVCDEFGTNLTHVKPHGALYNQAAKEPELATAIAEAVKVVDPKLILFGLASSHSITEAQRTGLRTASEVFADRTYENDGSLTPRTEPNALITDTKTSLEQVLNIVKYGRVRSLDAIMVAIKPETICIHGDGEHAVEFAQLINQSLKENGIEICPIA